MTATRVLTWTRRHLLDVDDLSRAELESVLDLAVDLRERRAAHDLPDTLRGVAVGTAFYEPSTRTRMSFELAARELAATVTDLSVAGSSVAKGESLVDTVRTLERTGIGVIVLRHAASGAPYLAVRAAERTSIVNAGDGTHAHPTQALLDALTLRDALGPLDGARITIVGDAVHSRVARSDLHAFVRLGASVVLSGPPAWVTAFAGWPGVSVVTDLDEALAGADAVMALRVQRERAAGSGVPSIGEYVARWGLTAERLERACPAAWLMHPGPANEGVEITAELSTASRSLIGRQVENGVPIRMSVLSLLAAEVDR
jgi:aspartate carbamoyltransferase catalytic subunit